MTHDPITLPAKDARELVYNDVGEALRALRRAGGRRLMALSPPCRVCGTPAVKCPNCGGHYCPCRADYHQTGKCAR